MRAIAPPIAELSAPSAAPSASPPIGRIPGPVATPRWPDLFIVGAARAGTTALRGYLDQHPGIFMAPMPEPHYFSVIRPGSRSASFHPVISDRDTYLGLYAAAHADQLRGEASTSYLWAAEAPARIHAVVAEARIVILLRDPVARAWSHYWHEVTEGFERRSFLRAVREELDHPGTWGVDAVYLGAGFYAEAVARYLGLFGRDHVAVSFYEPFRAHPRGTVHDLLVWLGLDPSVAEHLDLEPGDDLRRPRNRVTRKALAAPRLRKAARIALPDRLERRMRQALLTDADDPGMDETVAALLRDLYAGDVERLSTVLGIIPPWTLTGR